MNTINISHPVIIPVDPHVRAMLDFVRDAKLTLTGRESDAFDALSRRAGTDRDLAVLTKTASRFAGLHPELLGA